MSQKQVQAPKDDEGEVMGKYLTSFQRKLLQKNLQQDLSDKQRQRIQIMLLADRGKTQVEICRKLGCCQATARYWITMARTNQAHHWRSNPIGRPTLVHEEYLQRLKQLVTKSPQEVNVPNKDYQYPFRRWTAQKTQPASLCGIGDKDNSPTFKSIIKTDGLIYSTQARCRNRKGLGNWHSAFLSPRYSNRQLRHCFYF